MIQKIQKYLQKKPRGGLIFTQKVIQGALLSRKSEIINKKKQDFY
jgi:hypothetical protein